METLGYGTHLIVDGFALRKAVTAKDIETFLGDLASLLEPGKQISPEVHPVADLPTGFSAALLLPESHASLHTFETEGVLSLRIFSRHGVDLSTFTERLTDAFGVRRFESHLSNYSKTMAKDAVRRKRTLLGDRSYTAARLHARTIP